MKAIQIIWGIILIITGCYLFYAIPEKFQSLGNTSPNNIIGKLCFYLIAILLIGGGIKKLYKLYTSDIEEENNSIEKKNNSKL